MRRGDNVLAGGSFFVGIITALAGIVLLIAARNLGDDLRNFSSDGRTQTVAGMAVVLSLSAFCFFEAYQFFAFALSPQTRDRYYARFRLRKIKADANGK
jgi:hypothetical protein